MRFSLSVLLCLVVVSVRADWPQWGGSGARNNVSSAKNLPAEWSVGEFDPVSGAWKSDDAKNILWTARLGSQTYGTPVVAGGKIFCATNNGAGYVARYAKKVDLGCLLAFRQDDGRLLWQLSIEKHPGGSDIDWEQQGICSVPLVEGDRLWLVTNRGEVQCVDTEGFLDGENDGPYKDEPNTNRDEADIVWSFDMMKRLGSVQHNMASCSVTTAGDLLLVCTSNGVDNTHKKLAAPDAPAFIALNKKTGELIWADASPNPNILHGQWASPASAELGGVPQAIFPGGDGWLYSFLARSTNDSKPQLLWKFDCNPKTAIWKDSGHGTRNEIIATPVIADGRVYIATGQDPEYGEGPGRLWCIDPTRRGDVSAEIVVDKDGKPVDEKTLSDGSRRRQAVNAAAGEAVKPNPNSAAVWQYIGVDAKGDGKPAFEDAMHRALGSAAVANGLVVIGDHAGLVHCLDAKTGKPHWTHDMLASVWGTPLLADGKIFLGDEDGDLAVFELAAKKNLLAENPMGGAVYSTAVADGETLYIATRTHLVAIKKR